MTKIKQFLTSIILLTLCSYAISSTDEDDVGISREMPTTGPSHPQSEAFVLQQIEELRHSPNDIPEETRQTIFESGSLKALEQFIIIPGIDSEVRQSALARIGDFASHDASSVLAIYDRLLKRDIVVDSYKIKRAYDQLRASLGYREPAYTNLLPYLDASNAPAIRFIVAGHLCEIPVYADEANTALFDMANDSTIENKFRVDVAKKAFERFEGSLQKEQAEKVLDVILRIARDNANSKDDRLYAANSLIYSDKHDEAIGIVRDLITDADVNPELRFNILRDMKYVLGEALFKDQLLKLAHAEGYDADVRIKALDRIKFEGYIKKTEEIELYRKILATNPSYSTKRKIADDLTRDNPDAERLQLAAEIRFDLAKARETNDSKARELTNISSEFLTAEMVVFTSSLYQDNIVFKEYKLRLANNVLSSRVSEALKQPTRDYLSAIDNSLTDRADGILREYESLQPAA